MLLQQNLILNCFTGSSFIKPLSSWQFWAQAVRMFRKLWNQGIDFMQPASPHLRPKSQPRLRSSPVARRIRRKSKVPDEGWFPGVCGMMDCRTRKPLPDARLLIWITNVLTSATGHALYATHCAKYLWTGLSKLWTMDRVHSIAPFCIASELRMVLTVFKWLKTIKRRIFHDSWKISWKSNDDVHK